MRNLYLSEFSGLSGGVIFFISFLSVHVSIAQSNVSSKPLKVNEAVHALIQGDSNPAVALLQSTQNSTNKKLFELDILYHLEKGDLDETAELLTQYQETFSQNVETYAFASEVWRSIGHKANIFVKRRFYKKALVSKLKTGKLARNNPKYMTIYASALGQNSDVYNYDTQQSITKKISRIDEKWGYISQINLAQNSDNLDKGKDLAFAAGKRFHQDFDVLERIAQFFWTIKDYQSAQLNFSNACHNRPQKLSWHDEIKWINACYQVAIFAKQRSLSNELGIKALHLLLTEYSLPTTSNYEIAQLLVSLSNDCHQLQPAIKLLRRIIEDSENKELISNAKASLYKIQKM